MFEESLNRSCALLDPAHVSVCHFWPLWLGFDAHGLGSLRINSAILNFVTRLPFRHCGFVETGWCEPGDVCLVLESLGEKNLGGSDKKVWNLDRGCGFAVRQRASPLNYSEG